MLEVGLPAYSELHCLKEGGVVWLLGVKCLRTAERKCAVLKDFACFSSGHVMCGVYQVRGPLATFPGRAAVDTIRPDRE